MDCRYRISKNYIKDFLNSEKRKCLIVMEVSCWISLTLKHKVEVVHVPININLHFLKGDFMCWFGYFAAY